MEVARPTLVLVAGVSGSGKTTFARSLEPDVTRLSLDGITWAMEPGGRPTRASVLRAEDEVRTTARTLLAHGRSVAIDAPLCSRAQRDVYRKLAGEAGADVRLVVLRAAPDTIRARVAGRGAARPDAYPVGREQLDGFLSGFEWPALDERAEIIDTDR